MTRIGIIGTGWGARVQAPLFREAGLEIGGIAGHDSARTRKAAESLGIEAFDDWRKLVESPHVDIVTITTPPSEHLAMATAALENRKHVVSEKPTALNAKEAEQLVEAARRHPDRIAIIDHELRFLPSFRAARERVKELGGLRYAEIRYASPGRGDRSREWNWWSDAARGGGIWGAVGSHFVDTLRYLGFEIEAVHALLTAIIAERPHGNKTRNVTSDDFASIQFRLRGGGVAAMTLCAVAAGPDEASVITIHGELGAMRLTGEELMMCKPREAFARVAGGPLHNLPGNSPGGAFGSGTLLLGKALRAAVNGDRSALGPAATFEDGLAQQRVLDAARRSSENDGRWVDV